MFLEDHGWWESQDSLELLMSCWCCLSMGCGNRSKVLCFVRSFLLDIGFQSRQLIGIGLKRQSSWSLKTRNQAMQGKTKKPMQWLRGSGFWFWVQEKNGI